MKASQTEPSLHSPPPKSPQATRPAGSGPVLRTPVAPPTPRPPRRPGVIAQRVVEQGGKDLRLGEAPAGVTQTGAGHLPDGVAPDEVREALDIAQEALRRLVVGEGSG